MSHPWMPVYWADFFGDTCHLGAAETGAYFCLIGHYWLKGSLPHQDDRMMARVARMTEREWRKAKPILAEFFDAEWRHKRIESELEKAREKREKNAANGARGGQAKSLKDKKSPLANATISPERTANENVASRARSTITTTESSSLRSEDSPKTPPAKRTGMSVRDWFDRFWEAYPKRTNKKTSQARFESAVKSGVDPGYIIAAAERFSEAHHRAGTEPRYIKAPDAWLNAGKYDDEDLPQPARSSNGWAQLAIEAMEKSNGSGNETKRLGQNVLELPGRVENGPRPGPADDGELPRNPATDLIRDAFRRM